MPVNEEEKLLEDIRLRIPRNAKIINKRKATAYKKCEICRLIVINGWESEYYDLHLKDHLD